MKQKKNKEICGVTLITDCYDSNARGRQEARVSSFFPGVHVSFMGVNNELEAALCLVDALDAYGKSPGVVLCNVAPRGGKGKKWENGTPFGYLKLKNTYIFSTIDGYVLSLLQKTRKKRLEINTFDIPEAVRCLGVGKQIQEYIISTQFRSYEFLPRVARAILSERAVPTYIYNKIPELEHVMCYIDRFGNVKTSILGTEISKKKTNINLLIKNIRLTLQRFERLKDVPDGELGIVAGSSGLPQNRFVEIVVQGKSAKEKLEELGINISAGTKIEILN